jgi:hypothetical protein
MLRGFIVSLVKIRLLKTRSNQDHVTETKRKLKLIYNVTYQINSLNNIYF